MSASRIPKTKAQIDAMTPEEFDVMMKALFEEFIKDWENGWRPSEDNDDENEVA